MKEFRVSYQVKPEYVDTNKANIQKVMDELNALNHSGIRYASFLEEDGVSFTHWAMFKDDEASAVLNGLESFAQFRKELKASAPVKPPASPSPAQVTAPTAPSRARTIRVLI